MCLFVCFKLIFRTKSAISRKVKSGIGQEFNMRHFYGCFTRSEEKNWWGVPITKIIEKNVGKKQSIKSKIAKVYKKCACDENEIFCYIFCYIFTIYYVMFWEIDGSRMRVDFEKSTGFIHQNSL